MLSLFLFESELLSEVSAGRLLDDSDSLSLFAAFCSFPALASSLFVFAILLVVSLLGLTPGLVFFVATTTIATIKAKIIATAIVATAIILRRSFLSASA